MKSGDRLRKLREKKNLSQATSKSAPACIVATSPVSRTVIQFLRLKHWRRWLGLWKFPLQNHADFRLDHAFHHDLSRSIHHRNRNAFLMYIHADILFAIH